jgi:beta-glucosidase
MLEGRYTDAYLAEGGADAPRFTDEDLTVIAAPVDYVGISVCRPNVYVEPSEEPPGYRTIPISASHPKGGFGVAIVDREVMYWAPRHVHSLWNPKSIFITENGCAATDEIADDANIYDTDRLRFLRACLTQLQRVTSVGVPVRG